jgi:Ca2+-binding EF-hand superfamily protein
MSFDTDQDGKLDRSELVKLAQEMERRRGGQGGGPEQ